MWPADFLQFNPQPSTCFFRLNNMKLATPSLNQPSILPFKGALRSREDVSKSPLAGCDLSRGHLQFWKDLGFHLSQQAGPLFFRGWLAKQPQRYLIFPYKSVDCWGWFGHCYGWLMLAPCLEVLFKSFKNYGICAHIMSYKQYHCQIILCPYFESPHLQSHQNVTLDHIPSVSGPPKDVHLLNILQHLPFYLAL